MSRDGAFTPGADAADPGSARTAANLWPDAAATLWIAASAPEPRCVPEPATPTERERCAFGDGGARRPVETEAVGHHDEQGAVIDERQLLSQELGVSLGVAPEFRNRAEVRRRCDQRHAQLVAAACCRAKQRGELTLLRCGDPGVPRQEERLLQQHVAGGSPSASEVLGTHAATMATISVHAAARSSRRLRRGRVGMCRESANLR